MNSRLMLTFLCAAVVALCAAGSWGGAQQVLLDEPVRAGELTLFPDLNDETKFFYLPDKPRLATDGNGQPQFSFLRYVENVRSGADEAEAREGEGGGIVHAVVALEVTEDQLREAEQEVRRLAPGAVIQGPVVYRSGKFALVSSFTDTDGDLTTQVLGLGNAPILDGQKAAISMQLTKLGAKVLWQSFQMPAPDISFSFEMQLDGYRSPIEAKIEADFERIYDHKAFAAGIAGNYLSAEIRGAFDDLTETGAIKVTQVGDDAKMEAMLTTAYNKLTEMMFRPIAGTGTPTLAGLTSSRGEPSVLDRATAMLRAGQARTAAENERIRKANREAAAREAAAKREAGAPGTAAPGATAPTPKEGRPKKRSESKRPSAAGGEFLQTANPDDKPSPGTRTPQAEKSAPAFAVAAAFEMKRVRQRGRFTIDLNKYTSDSLTMRFDENIGDLSDLTDDPAYFRAVNLDDPLYRQREIVAFIDGLNAADFGEYINFVTVQMRKRHAGGDVTDDEVRIDRNNFNAEGNAFKLLYGWQGDNDRRRWMDYDYRTSWSFFGGESVDVDWQSSSNGAIDLVPPYQPRFVDVEADPDLMADAQVRLVTVKIFYPLGGAEQTKQVTLNPAKDQLSARVGFISPANEFDYDYEITWRLRGNTSVSSGRQTTSEAVLFADELPDV